ncbi:MAG: alpha/beta hydrolase family protein, partial [Burkholderiales bacterium]
SLEPSMNFLQRILLAVSLVALPCQAQTGDGTVVSEVSCKPINLSYVQYLEASQRIHLAEAGRASAFGIDPPPFADFQRTLFTEQEYLQRTAPLNFECLRIRYLSDGMEVVGHIFKPIETSGKKFPVIIYNRGGNREFSKNTPFDMVEFYDFLKAGFVVIASQYRGNDGGEGREEFGGADVKDVLNLVPLARSLGYADTNNIFMYGHSRGAMMTLLAIKEGCPIRAAAVVGVSSDLEIESARRPELARMESELIPGFDEDPESAYFERSAANWAHRIDVPLLILHGADDWRVEVGQALTLARELIDANNDDFELKIYANDDHSLTLNREDKTKRIVGWFQRHSIPPVQPQHAAVAGH